MKLNYKTQLTVCVLIVLLTNIISTILKHWIYRSIGFAVCGLLFLVHPVVPNSMEGNKKAVFWTRIAGVVLILIGAFTRSYIY